MKSQCKIFTTLRANSTTRLHRDPNLCLAGFSMGGAMSSVFASKYHISKLLLLAPYYGLTHFNNLATPLGRFSYSSVLHTQIYNQEEYSLEKVIKNINVLYTLSI